MSQEQFVRSFFLSASVKGLQVRSMHRGLCLGLLLVMSVNATHTYINAHKYKNIFTLAGFFLACSEPSVSYFPVGLNTSH